MGAALVATGAAWSLMGHGSAGTGMPGLLPGAHAPGLHAFAALVIMWQSMMVAMMTPAVLPWLLTVERLVEHRTRLSRLVHAASFASGYFFIWLAYGVAASVVQFALQHAQALDRAAALRAPMGGAVLVAAGVVQFTPLKQACLAHCRNPLGFLLTRWRDGPAGAFGLGLRHGTYCLGCCWAIMAAGFALGAMNALWMAILTLIVCVEQLAPGGDRVARAVGLGFALLGLLLMASVR